MQKNSRLRPFVLASALWIPLSLPAVAGTSSDAELLTRMHQEVQTLEQQMQTAYAQCQAGKRQACEQASQRQKQLARMQELIEGCQRDERESCTQLRDLRRR
jgi:hypothetical protein